MDMTDRGAQFLSRGRRSTKSSREAWSGIKDRNEDTDWEPEAMIAERERRGDAATSGAVPISAVKYVGDNSREDTPEQ